MEPRFKDRAPRFAPIDGSHTNGWQFEGKVFPAFFDRPERRRLGRIRREKARARHLAAGPLMMALGGLLTGGVFERFPGLKAAFLEGSCSWVPWWLWSLDERVEKFGDDQRFRLTMRPSEYFRHNCWVSVDPDDDIVRHAIPTMGDDNIVISTDWPHDDSAYPRSVDTFLALDGLTEATKRKILWDNCARLYGLS
jgi:predicted TIM-barrel fold metal-dependent hydrolase